MTTKQERLSADRLRELLFYNDQTGQFTWLQARGRASVGKVAGHVDKDGYIIINIDEATYRAHRLAWLYQTGHWPEKFIDHIDGQRTNNTFSNLRECTQRENMQNIAPTKGKSLPTGVCKNGNRYQAKIRRDGLPTLIGSFDSAEEASQAYLAARREFFTFCPNLRVAA